MTVSNSPYSQQNVRRNMVSFIFGRGISALITFSILVLAARVMDLQAYGQYMLILAGMEIGMALGTFGIDWVIARYVPACRQHGSVAKLKRLVYFSLFSQLFLLAFVVSIVALLLKLSVFSIPAFPVSLLYVVAFLYVAEGFGRIIRDQILGALMLQAGAQKAQVLRGLVVFVGLVLLYFLGININLKNMIFLELSGAIISGLIALVFLWRNMAGLHYVSDGGWDIPSANTMCKLMFSSYANTLSLILTGPQILIFIIASIWGASASGIFGFARSLADQVRRYLPFELFLGGVRALVMSKIEKENLQELMNSTFLISRLSLMVSFPLLFVFSVWPIQMATLIGGLKVAESGLLVLPLLCISAMFPLRRFLEIFYFGTGQGGRYTWYSVSSGVLSIFIFLAIANYFDSLLYSVFFYSLCIVVFQSLAVVFVETKWNGAIYNVVNYSGLVVFFLMAFFIGCLVVSYFVAPVVLLGFIGFILFTRFISINELKMAFNYILNAKKVRN